MKQKFFFVLFVVVLCGFSFSSKKSEMNLEDFKIVNPYPDSTQSYFQRYGYYSQDQGQSGETIKYLVSKKDDFEKSDTLETYLIKDKSLVKIFDKDGLVMVVTLTQYSSTDDLFNGYADWSVPIWNEENPNIAANNTVNDKIIPWGNRYKEQTFNFFTWKCGVRFGWNPQMPAHFINRRNGYKEEGRNIYNFKTVAPISENRTEIFDFWAECGIFDPKMIKDKKY